MKGLICTLLLLFILTACSASQSQPSSTPILPTNTSHPPTDSPIPPSPTLVPTDTPKPGSTPTKTIEQMAVDPALSEPPPGYKLYTAPHLIAFYYPEEWVQVYDEFTGDIHFATEGYGLYSGIVPDAEFKIFLFREHDNPLTVLNDIIKESGSDVMVIEDPQSIRINYQEAASTLISVTEQELVWVESEEGGKKPGEESIPKFTRITLIQGPEHIAYVISKYIEDQKNQYQSILDTMLNSVFIREGLPKVDIGVPSETTPDGYVSYVDECEYFQLYHPKEWSYLESTFDVTFVEFGYPEKLAEQDEPAFGTLEIFLIEDLYARLAGGFPGELPEEILQWIIGLVGYTNSTFHDAFPVTEITSMSRANQEIARVVISGTVDGIPALGLFQAIRYADSALIANILLMDKAELYEYTRIMDTILMTEPLAKCSEQISEPLAACSERISESPQTLDPGKLVDMVLIPSGEFIMGDNGDDLLAECQKYDTDTDCGYRTWLYWAEPEHKVYLDDFYIDIYEVTNTQYAQCVESGCCDLPSKEEAIDKYKNNQYADHPVVGVTWQDAQNYCQWAGKRLPTEAEWEKAARGGLQGKLYPWGDEDPICELGAQNGAQFHKCSSDTMPVGSFSPNGYGLYDMAGNVAELVNDYFDNFYYQDSPYKNPTGPSTDTGQRVVRGGSWADLNPYLLSVALHLSPPAPFSSGKLDTGFRCALTP